MPRLALPAAAVAMVAVASSPALAADHTITASSNFFTDAAITIAPGDRVLFANAGGLHNFEFEDGPAFPASPTLPGAAWNGLERVFPSAGTYPYFCAQHGAPGGVGMSGVVTAAAPSPGPQPGPGPSPQPGPQPGPQPSPTGEPPAAPGTVQVRTLEPVAARFCARRGPRCRRPGVRVRIDLSAPARVTGVLRRRAKRFGRVDFGTVAAGPRTLRFRRTAADKRLVAGRYTLAVSVDGDAAKTLAFRVR